MQKRIDQDASPPDVEEAAQDWLLRLSSGGVTAEDLTAFRAWRDADPRHRAAYDEVCSLWRDVEGLRVDFAASLPASRPEAAALPPAIGRGRVIVTRRRLLVGGLAAAAAAISVAGTDLPDLLRADHRSEVGKQSTVVLPDGSIAHLNTGAAIALGYSALRREVSLLRSEALFEAERDAARPFSVLARKGRALALDTAAFAVRDRGNAATVTVIDGTVQVSSAIDDSPGVTLKAGQQVTYEDGAAPGPIVAVDTAAATAWRRGVIMLDRMPLAQSIAEIARYRRGKILLLANTSELAPVTARLSIASLDSGIRALAATHDLRATEVTDYLMIIH